MYSNIRGHDLSRKEQLGMIRKSLPAFKMRRQFLYAIQKYQVVIIIGETGSGKSTQIPQYLDESGWTGNGMKIVVSVPRRVAALTVSQRVADEMGVEHGGAVGYAVRFDDRTSTQTRIKFVTDGLLLREAITDPLLSRYSVVIIDDAHDRSLSSDILLGLLKRILRKRPELRVIVSSATIDAEAFYQFFSYKDFEKELPQRLSRFGGFVEDVETAVKRMKPSFPEPLKSKPKERTRDRDISSIDEGSDYYYRPNRTAAADQERTLRHERRRQAKRRKVEESSSRFEDREREKYSARDNGSGKSFRSKRDENASSSFNEQRENATSRSSRTQASRERRERERSVSPPTMKDFFEFKRNVLRIPPRSSSFGQPQPPSFSDSTFQGLREERPTRASPPPSPCLPPATGTFSRRGDEKTEEKRGENSTQLKPCTILKFPGRTFPVTIAYTAHPVSNYVQAAVETALHVHISECEQLLKESEARPPKRLPAILIFLPGQEEVEAAVSMILQRAQSSFPPYLPASSIYPLPLYSSLPAHLQSPAFKAPPSHPSTPFRRKVVVSTNIAETAVTIPDVSIVIDSCVVKTKASLPVTGVSTLHVSLASQAACNQRAGRAGRVGPGRCFRLLTESAFMNLLPHQTVPEVMRTDLASTLLSLKLLGVSCLPAFELITPPTSEAFRAGLEKLLALGALDSAARMTTKYGALLAELPLDLELNRLVLLSTTSQFYCAEEAIIIAAMLSVASSPFLPPSAVPPPPSDANTLLNHRERLRAARNSFSVAEGDFLMLYNVYAAWEEHKEKGDVREWVERHCLNQQTLQRASEVKNQIESCLNRLKISWRNVSLRANDKDATRLLKCIAFSFCLNAARYYKEEGCYYFVRSFADGNRGPPMIISPSMSSFIPAQAENAHVVGGGRWIVFKEAVAAGGERGEATISGVSVIDPDWLHEACPSLFKPISTVIREHVKKKSEYIGDAIDVD